MTIMLRRTRPGLGKLLAASALLCQWVPITASAQLIPFGVQIQDSVSSTFPTSTQSRGAPQGTPPISNGPLLDRAINRSEYVVGPGDMLSLSIIGFRSQQFTFLVSPEQTVVVPEVGVVRVGGLTIDAAESEVARAVRRVHRDVQVDLTLVALRSFKIYVVGDLDAPGMREATPVTRVSEVVPHADSEGVIHRNIVLRRTTGEESLVDLARFLQLGDLSQNPTLREGDILQVPIIDETVRVTGSVRFPAEYAYRHGESVSDILRLASGGSGFLAGAADTIRLMRSTSRPGDTVVPIAREDAASEIGRSIPLLPFDALFLPRLAHFGRVPTAEVTGEVARPGVYPITPNVTTVRDLVEMAGGFTPEGSVLDAVLRRTPIDSPRDGIVGLERVPSELLSREDRRVLQVTSRADARAVVVDFSSLLEENGTGLDVPLEDGDQLFVPEQRLEVSVLGAVIQPGILPYVPGGSLDYYIGIAGGFSQDADRDDLMVLKARTGSRLQRKEVAFLEPGDRLIVPFREHLTVLERLQTAQGVMSTIGGFVLGIIAIQQVIDRVVN